jgi:hypothetical protein
MTVKDTVSEVLDRLPIAQQQEVLDFAEFLEQKYAPKQPRKSLFGILSDLNIDVTEEDIREARNEMWRGYTKDTEDYDRMKKYEDS